MLDPEKGVNDALMMRRGISTKHRSFHNRQV